MAGIVRLTARTVFELEVPLESFTGMAPEEILDMDGEYLEENYEAVSMSGEIRERKLTIQVIQEDGSILAKTRYGNV